ncbi:zinc finger protein 595-like isoform X2 [Ceratina calcarata]|uniref:Zinc finger protein 595-like isoform X2 n=1 Tax=Ceratina calcarata TaxID=156304 RepID=A0AAJ7S6F1_9HYME|nr:zinc finger protein 595-like isoform X2 [Ceratina calcarata]
MGSLNLVCPMCCGETFNNPQSLKYHLLSMTDNLYCPGCSQRSDSVMALIQHLDQCGQSMDADQASPEVKDEHSGQQEEAQQQESETETEVLMDTNVEGIDQSFLATVNDSGIMIVGGPQTIQVDENGDIKVVEKMMMDTEETPQVQRNSLQFKMEKVPNIVTAAATNKEEKKSFGTKTNRLVTISTESDVMDDKEDRNTDVITILPDGSELLNAAAAAAAADSAGTLINMDHINDVGELDEDGLLRVKQELCEIEPEAVYSCTSCDISFNSVVEHIKQFHDGQEVLLEIADQLDDIPTTAAAAAAVNSSRQRQSMNTLRTEECVDSEGRLYTRKVVQIERFWDRAPTAQTSLQSAAKSPMIEKFFSNAEGVKVREKRLATAPMRMYRCNQCLQQFSKLGNFRVHACLHGNNRCHSCDQTFATPKALQLHAKVHEGEPDPSQKTFICETCGTEFCSHKSLRLHSRMHAPVRARHVDAPEGTPNATFTCPECGKTLAESYKEAHMALHSGDSVTCTVCNRKFDSADSLAMHAAVHTELSQPPPHSPTPPSTETAAAAAAASANSTQESATENQKPYQCQHCGRRFTRPHEKVKHERIHTGEKPHACEVCGKTFRVSYCLTLHMRTHTGVRPYGCQHCGKRFKASSVYNHHLLTHGEERAYTCPYCPKTFKTRVQLAGHKNSHTKPFRCTECSRPFASLYAARAHIQTHKKDNNLKFSCYICGASYGRAFALKDHLKQHGQDVLAPPEPSAAAAAAREEEIHEPEEQEDFLLAEEEVEDDELIIPSPLPVTAAAAVIAQSSEADDTE